MNHAGAEWHSAALFPAGKKERKNVLWAKLFGSNSFSSCPDLTRLNIYSAAVKPPPRAFSCFFTVVMTKSCSLRNSVPFGYFSISRFTSNQRSVSIEEVGLKAELWKVVVLQGEVFRGLQKFDVHVLLLKKTKKKPHPTTGISGKIWIYILSVVT